jgi:hypothetical protein
MCTSHRLAPVARLGDDLQLRPQAFEMQGELLAQQGFVVSGQRDQAARNTPPNITMKWPPTSEDKEARRMTARNCWRVDFRRE